MFRIFRRAFVYKTYRAQGCPAAALDTLTRHLLAQGMVKTADSGVGLSASFRYPSIFFSSKRPFTCISELTVETRDGGGETKVRIGATFTKIRNYTIFIFGFIWIGLPVIMAFMKSAVPNFSPFGGLVVPVGFLLHYSVRGRVFRAVKRLVESGGDANGIQ